ncbi:MAG: phosphate ABC transporter substrate-binding protein PstS [Anaerolineaceae bacterium]
MRKSLIVTLFVVLVAALAMSACGQAVTPTTAPAGSDSVPTVSDVVAATATLAPGSIQINAGGATFPLPVYTQWTYAYQYVDPSVVLNYQGTGSGAGKSGILDNTLDFAGSDSLLSADQYTQGKDLQMYPMLAGAVVVIYNVSWAKDFPADFKASPIVLDRQTLAAIYNGTVNKWNDPAIMALNPTLDGYLPDATITVVHRSDGSGTTEIFTKALTSFSADWTAGGAASVEWPVDKKGNGIGGKGNQGVAAAVINTKNSLGYVELSYAIANKLSMTSLINKAGKTVVANAASVASDMTDFANAFDAKLNATIVDGAGEGSWPITGYTYIILHTTSMSDCVKASKIVEYLNWTLTDTAAIKAASDLGYSVLPTAVRDLVLAKLAEVTCNGQPVK